MKELLCYMLVFLGLSSISAQKTFDRLYKDNNHIDYGWSITRTSKNTYLIASGTLCNYTTGCDRLLEVDSVGNLLWSKVYLDEEFGSNTNGQKSFFEINNKYLTYGTRFKEGDWESYIREVDKQGQIVDVIFPAWTYEQISRRVVPLDDGDFYLVGISVPDDQPRDGLSISRLDSSYNVLIEKNVYNDSFSYRLNTVDRIGEDHLLIAATQLYRSGGLECLELIWLNGLGEIVWRKTMFCSDGSYDIEEPGAFYNQETGLILYQRNEKIRDLLFEGIDPRSIQMEWVDTSGLVHYNDTIFIPLNTGDDYYNNLVELDNGDVLGVGSGVVPASVDPEKPPAAMLDCFSPYGEHKWRRYISSVRPGVERRLLEQFVDAVSASDGGIVATGDSQDTLVLGNGNVVNLGHTWVVKLDSMGCMEPGCDDPVIILDIPEVQTKLSEIKQKYISVQPNPILASNDPLRINVLSPSYIKDAWVSIHNVEGKLIDRWLLDNNKTSYDVSMVGHHTGLYIIQYGRAGRVLQAEKIIVH